MTAMLRQVAHMYGPVGRVSNAVMFMHAVVHESVSILELHEGIAFGLLRKCGSPGFRIVMSRMNARLFR